MTMKTVLMSTRVHGVMQPQLPSSTWLCLQSARPLIVYICTSLRCFFLHTNLRVAHYDFSPVRYVFSFKFFGDLETIHFLETLGPTESEKQCLRFFQVSSMIRS